MKTEHWRRIRFGYAAFVFALCLGCASTGTAPAGPSAAEIPQLEARIAREPNDVTTALRLGVAYEDAGRFADARRLYQGYIQQGRSAKLRKELQQRLPLLQRRELEAAVKQAAASETAGPPEPFTVAVFPFLFVGPDSQYQPLGRALAEFLVNDLSQTGRIKVLERAHVQLLLNELRLAQTRAVDPATAARAGRMLRAERVVQGSLDGNPRSIQTQTSIVRVGTNRWPGEPAAAPLRETDALSALTAMQKRLALRIYASLGIVLTEAERERVNRRATENLNAILAYGRGLEAEDQGNFTLAARHYAEAAALDPSFVAARSAETRATDAGAAASVDTRELLAGAEFAPVSPGFEDFFLPDPIRRDAAAEILRTEGGARSTILEIIIRRN